jgi:adenine-specific DNA methylase
MIPRSCKRLAEVDFPIAEVSKHSAREKYAGKGYPNLVHIWWARRPYGACRAMLMALLLPDPCDAHCPPEFRQEARALLSRWRRDPGADDGALRQALLAFIGEFANWDYAASPLHLEVSRGLVKAANGAEPPLVVDPFAGGGSIPLEALRLGCDAFASDLNPVACLILKVMLEDIPRHGPGLADELRRAGKEIKAAAEKELAEFYPPDPDGARPIAYLWARTVRCESPNCGAEIPLVRSFWLSKKTKRRRALHYKVVRPAGQVPRIEFEIFEPRGEADVPKGTVTRAKATCLCCQVVLAPERVRAQLAAQRGGADAVFDAKGNRVGGARILAVVTLSDDAAGRQYRLTTDRDYAAVQKAVHRAEALAQERLPSGLSIIPDEPMPPVGTLGFRVQRYGVAQWGHLFTARQKVVLSRLASEIRNTGIIRAEFTRSVAAAFDRVAMSDMSCTRWNPSAEKMQHTFGRQALPIVWDFAEVAPLEEAPGNWESGYELLASVAETWGNSKIIGQAAQADACEHPLGQESAGVWFTDPPYYDSVPYADLSDFFFVWLKRLLPAVELRDPFDQDNLLTPT